LQQPIASLLGEDKGMFDVLVRMLDEQGSEVLPAEFMAAAERNDLMKHRSLGDRRTAAAMNSAGSTSEPCSSSMRTSTSNIPCPRPADWRSAAAPDGSGSPSTRS